MLCCWSHRPQLVLYVSCKFSALFTSTYHVNLPKHNIFLYQSVYQLQKSYIVTSSPIYGFLSNSNIRFWVEMLLADPSLHCANVATGKWQVATRSNLSGRFAINKSHVRKKATAQLKAHLVVSKFQAQSTFAEVYFSSLYFKIR